MGGDCERVKEMIRYIKRRAEEEYGCVEVSRISCLKEIEKVTVFNLPDDLSHHFLCMDVETRFCFLNNAPHSVKVKAVGTVDEYESDQLAKVLPLSEWDEDVFNGHGATEDTYDGFRFLLPGYKITEELFIVNIREKNRSPRNTLKLVATKKIETFDEMEAEIKRLFEVTWKKVSAELDKREY